MTQNRRYCPTCDDDTLIFIMGNNGNFYHCMNRRKPGVNCTVKQEAYDPPFQHEGGKQRQGDYVPPSIDKQPSQIAMESGAVIIEAQARKELPGFGIKRYDDMTDPERSTRAAYFMDLMPKSVFRVLPYDKADRCER